MNNPGFAKIFRKIQDHWIYENAVWLKAWITIIQDAEWKEDGELGRGELVLTEVYRKLKGDFTKNSWHYFLRCLIEDGMIEVLSTENLGRGKGFRQVAIVKNYDEYHGKNQETVKEAVNKQQTTQQRNSTTPSQTAQTAGQETARKQQENEKETVNNAVYKELNTIQELKEEKDTSSKKHEDTTDIVKADESPPTVELVETHPHGEFYQAWNDNCGNLPKSYDNKGVDQLLAKWLKEVAPDDLARRIAKGACVVRHETWWQQNRYGLKNLLRNLDSKVEIYDDGQGFTGQSASFESEYNRIMAALT